MLADGAEREILAVQALRQNVGALLALNLEVNQNEFRRVVPFVDVFPAYGHIAHLHAHLLLHGNAVRLHAQADAFDFLNRGFF